MRLENRRLMAVIDKMKLVHVLWGGACRIFPARPGAPLDTTQLMVYHSVPI